MPRKKKVAAPAAVEAASPPVLEKTTSSPASDRRTKHVSRRAKRYRGQRQESLLQAAGTAHGDTGHRVAA